MINLVKCRLINRDLNTMIKSLENMEHTCRNMADIDDMYTLSELDDVTEKIIDVELELGKIKEKFDEIVDHCVVKRLGLGTRAVNALIRNGYEIEDIYSMTPEELAKVRGIGKKTLEEILKFKEENS